MQQSFDFTSFLINFNHQEVSSSILQSVAVPQEAIILSAKQQRPGMVICYCQYPSTVTETETRNFVIVPAEFSNIAIDGKFQFIQTFVSTDPYKPDFHLLEIIDAPTAKE